MGLIKTLTIGGEKYDISADVKLASRGGLSKNADGEIGVYTGNGLYIYLLSNATYGELYLPLSFNDNGAICIRTSTQDSPAGSSAGAYSALQSDGNKVFINLYTLSKQLTNFMEIREGQLIYKFNRDL